MTYTNPHRWLPAFRPAPGEAALAALVRGYLHAYGPATPQHFAKWLGISPRSATGLFGTLAAGLERVELDGEPGWTVAGDTGTPPGPHRGIRLLPYFDAYVVAGQPRDRLYPGPAASRALTPAGQAGNYPVLLVDGVVGGVWHQRRTGGQLAITVEPLRELTAAQLRQLDDEAGLVGSVMAAAATLTVGPVTVGAHALAGRQPLFYTSTDRCLALQIAARFVLQPGICSHRLLGILFRAQPRRVTSTLPGQHTRPRRNPMNTMAPTRPTERHGCRIRLTARPAAAAEARSQVREVIWAWRPPVDPDVAILLTSDLVTNAIKYAAGGTVTLAVRCGHGQLRIDVDGAAGTGPARRTPRLVRRSGQA